MVVSRTNLKMIRTKGNNRMFQLRTSDMFKKSSMRGVFETREQALRVARSKYPFLKKEGIGTFFNYDKETKTLTIVEIIPYTIGTIV